jgi:subtilisin-like proprotein convertase family protein
MRSGLALILLFPLFACIKEEATITEGNAGGDTGGAAGGSFVSGQDPLAAQAWHLRNTGANKAYSESAGLSGEDIDLTYVHETLDVRGRNIRIAVSDTGTEIDHPDLAGNALGIAYHRNYVGTSAEWHGRDPLPTLFSASEAHGTAVAGLAAAVGWNSLGSRGVAPGAKFGAFRFLFPLPDTETDESLEARDIDQTTGDFHVFNYSYGPAAYYLFTAEDDDVLAAVAAGAMDQGNGVGSVYVQSAGNSFTGLYEYPPIDDDPVTYVGTANAHQTYITPYKIIVGATNALGEKASYSSTGSNLWVSAPGGEDGDLFPAMIAPDLQGCNAGMSVRNINKPTHFNYGGHASNRQCDYTNEMNGTSSAAPVTAGVIALMLEAKPGLTWRDVKHILVYSADKIDGPDTLADPRDIIFHPALNTLDHPVSGRDVSGHDYDYKWILNGAGHLFSNWYGFGRVNAADAVVMAKDYELGTLGTFEQTMNTTGTWYYGSGTVDVPIDEQDGATGVELSESRIWVGHNYSVEYVEIELTTDHPFPGDLGVMLESPAGTESRLLAVNSMHFNWNATKQTITIPLGSSAFYEELSEGFWTLRILDGSVARGTGDITSWKILVSGHRPAGERSNPYPPTAITLGTVPASDLTVTPVFSFTPTVTSGVTYQASVVEVVGTTETVIRNWTSIGTSPLNRQLTGLVLTGDTAYYLRLRAVDGAGRVSSTQLVEWRTPNI